ncbi:TadE/TadG family type IV pilus assembly protein [Vibrio gallicus]|uniref:TadE/TadG family type IV pilus assembly protein n=1 Tax=Vibrio gallicus TaxID=190897 RepID=UPI0021C350EA|nr:TadE/TadG family type IV pilus assembly protein [Vibrio gallicus]
MDALANKKTARIQPRPPRRFGFRSIRGASLIEFSIVATLLFSLLFTIIDFALYGYVKLTMQHAVREGARYAVTGRADLDPDEDNDGQERALAILEKISQESDGLLTKVVKLNGVRAEDSNGNDVTATFGGAGETVAIHIDCEWPTFSPIIYPILSDGKYQFTVSTAMKNEAF